MSLGLLIILIIKSQFNFDTFHANADRIYRINTRALRTNGDQESYATSPYPLGASLQQNYSFAEEVVRICRHFNGDAVYGNTNVPVSGLFVDQSFLRVFNFPLASGDLTTVLTLPDQVVLTHETAARIFGNRDPLGQVIRVSGYGDFTVTGVLQPFPGQTHFDFELLGSSTAIPQLVASGVLDSLENDWNNYYGSLVYVKMFPGKEVSEMESALARIAQENYKGLKLEARDRGYEFFVQALGDITPGPVLSNQMGRGMPTMLLIFFSVLGGVVLLMSCFNFTNLTIAKSLTRAREIGVRKVIGAKRSQVFGQFIGETITFTLVALLIAYVFLQFLKTGFLQLPFNEEFAITLQEDYIAYLMFVVFALLVGVVASLMPAIYLSAFKPVRVLKDAGSARMFSGLSLRKGLITAQVMLSLIFVTTILVIYSQIDFVLTADYGFNEKNKINIRLQGMAFDRLATEVKSIPGVIHVGGVSHPLGTWHDRSSEYKRTREDEPTSVRDFFMDAHYLANLELEFLAGQPFAYDQEKRNESLVILNEQALVTFGFDDPVSAVGKEIYVHDTVMLTVAGVVRNFHFRPMNTGIGALVLRSNSSEYAYLSAAVVPGQEQAVLSSIDALWKGLDPVHPVDRMTMENEIDDAYRQAGMYDLMVIVGYVSFLAVTLACLGMLGMAMYLVQTRTKEVGIRKVMGAETLQVIYLLSKSFFVVLAMAFVLGVPVSWFLGNQFLNLYAYKIDLGLGIILQGMGIITLLGILTVGSQTWRAAVADPVKSLRYE
jgi:putative ABC transport system permease protein